MVRRLQFLIKIDQKVLLDPEAGKDGRQKEKRAKEDEMVRQHDQLSGHKSDQTPGDSKGQESLVCCSPWGRKESDTTYQLNNDRISATAQPESAALNPTFDLGGVLRCHRHERHMLLPCSSRDSGRSGWVPGP